MDEELTERRAETDAHAWLKRLSLLWAQAQGYTACAVEVSLPRSRYRADLAAYRPGPNPVTAIFECKQARADLRRNNCCTAETRQRMEDLSRRRRILETNLRVHYPALTIADSLFAEFHSHDFEAIGHRGYLRVIRELRSLHRRVTGCAKFETLVRYRCANLFFLVLPNDLYHEADVPSGWGALVEKEDGLALIRKPLWHETSRGYGIDLLVRIARAGTRALNRQLEITFDDVAAERSRSYSAANADA
jgi:hypothetical protein